MSLPFMIGRVFNVFKYFLSSAANVFSLGGGGVCTKGRVLKPYVGTSINKVGPILSGTEPLQVPLTLEQVVGAQHLPCSPRAPEL